MNGETENWLASAEYDLETAQKMLETGRYLYVVFMCHLAVEKTLKALVCSVTGSSPPRIHDLIRLAALAQVKLDTPNKEFVERLTDASVTTRYPENIGQVSRLFDEVAATSCLDSTRKVISCLRADPRLRR